MRKVHVKAELDILVYANDDVDFGRVMQDFDFSCKSRTDDIDIIDVQVVSTEVTDSR